MRAVEHGALGLDDAVGAHVPQWAGSDRAGVTIRDLLSHCSGLPGYRPLFQEAAGRGRLRADDLRFAAGVRAQEPGDLQRPRLHPARLDPRARHAASRIASTAFWARAGAGEELAVPSAGDAGARGSPRLNSIAGGGRLLVGEVHDENCFAMGGVAGHAGLFGTASAVGAFARHVLQVLDGRAGGFSQASIVEFTTRRGDVPGSSRALAWDTMLPTSSCGTRMSPRGDRPHRLHRHEPVAGSGTPPAMWCCSPTACTRRGPGTASRRCARRSTTR